MRAKRRMGLVAAAMMAMAAPALVSGADDSCVWVATLVSVEGTVEVRRKGDDSWKALAVDERVFEGDTLRVLRRSRAALQFRNSATMRLDQETTVTLGEVKPRRSFWVQMLTGASYFFSHAPRSLEIRTPFVNGSIEGTEFAVAVGQAEGTVAVFDGRVVLSNEHGRLPLGSGETAVAPAGRAPAVRARVASGDMAQWTVFFPPAIVYRVEDFSDSSADLQNAVRAAVARRQAGDVSGALAALPEKTDAIGDPRFFVMRAEMLMAIGRHAEAGTDISRALSLKPGCGDALALRAMAAVVANRREEALGVAAAAVKADARSVAARMAQSYAQQAAANLDAALAAAREAMALDAGNAAARARVAELLLMRGDRRGAVEEATRAVQDNPSSSLAHTVLGFAHLARTDRPAAEAEFRKAIALAPADPQPRLGLGLAKIRGGDLAGGRAELEIAVALDPTQSLLRSYLGKAYAEENRDGLAERELGRARALDPNDPTPYFYDAMRKQTLNRPGEALVDMQEAIGRNDNRAVYRSNLLLDRDLAVRGVSQARIYEDLGFSQVAFVEACRSVMLDPGNASAHRFLADAYAGMPRSEIARESELLVAQLRQPQGAGLIQPRLGEARPGVLTGVGAVDPAYNEYTRLFERDGWRGMASVFAGNQQSWGQEVIAGGVFGRYAFSAGESRIMSDGFRENADIDERVQNVIGSFAVTPEFTLLAGYRRQEVSEGDTELHFDPESRSMTLRQYSTRETIQLAGRLAFGPRSDLVAVVQRQDLHSSSFDSMPLMMESLGDPSVLVPVETTVEARGDDSAWSGELQYLSRSRSVDLLFGGSLYANHDTATIRVSTLDGDPDFPDVDESDHVRHMNGYLYTMIRPLDVMTIVAGASLDSLDYAEETKSQFNPKLGLLWMPLKTTAIRAVGLRVLKRSLVAQQTLEPADLAGFRQFTDDPSATDTWRYGLAVDQKVGRSLFVGVLVETAIADIPYIDPSMPDTAHAVERRDWHTCGYLYYRLADTLSGSGELSIFRQDSDQIEAPFAHESTSLLLPVGLRYQLPNGLFLATRVTMVRQNGRLMNPESGSYTEREETFVTTDVDVGVRLRSGKGRIGLEVRNLFDREFLCEATEAGQPHIEPARSVLFKASATF